MAEKTSFAAARRRLATISFTVFVLLGSPGAVALVDLRLLVDVSASMASADPEGLRAETAGLLLELLPEGAYGGLWTFAGRVNMVVPHGRVDAGWKAAARASSLELPVLPAAANLAAALEKASWDATSSVSRERHLVVITDSRAAAGSQQALAPVLKGLGKAGIPVHVLALDDAQASLEPLSRATGGHYRSLRRLEELPAFAQMLFDGVAQPAQLLSTGQRSFLVEPGAKEFSVLWRPDGPAPDPNALTLTDPAGRRYTRRTPNIGFRWHSAASYDLVTFRAPLAGRWHLDSRSGRVANVYAASDLSLVLSGLPAMVFPGDVKGVAVALETGAGEILDADFLELVTLEATLLGGVTPEVLPVTREAGGFMVKLLSAEAQGAYSVDLTLRGPTFERHLEVPFTVRNPISLELLPEGDGAVVWLALGAGEVVPEQTRVSAVLTRPLLGTTVVPAERYPGGLWRALLSGDPGLLELVLEVEGKLLKGQPFSVKTDPVVMSLPLAQARRVNFAIGGQEISSELREARAEASEVAPPPAAQPSAAPVEDTAANVEEESLLPWQFAAAIALLNLIVGFSCFFLLRPPAPAERFFTALTALEAALDPAPETVDG